MAMQATTKKDGEPTSEINTTPLIDVMLVLLIMLIVTLPPQRNAVKIDTPHDTQPIVRVEPAVIRLAVDFDGSVEWNGEPVTHDQWEQRMAIEARRDPQPEIHVEPHPLAKYGQVAAVMSSAQREGLTKLGVVGGTQAQFRSPT